MLVTAFRSPATAVPFGTSIPGSTLPAYYFASRLTRSTARSASWLRRLNRFAPTPAVSLPQTRCGLSGSPRLAAPPASTPLRDFCLPRDQSVQQVLLPASPPSGSARSPLAPRRRYLFTRVTAADHRSRSATLPEACCSSNLLEPIAVWLPSAFTVNAFCIVLSHFPQFLFALLPSGYSARLCNACGKNTGSSSCFDQIVIEKP
jgi:hypothetical protein